jgi:UDPglucose 6-dehydrogenase
MEMARAELPEVTLCQDVYQLAEGCDALVLATEWEDFRYLEWPRVRAGMRGDIFIDGRNFYESETMAQAGFRYRAMGRGLIPE